MVGTGYSRRDVLRSGAAGASLLSMPLFASVRSPMFDGHMHLVSDDQTTFPRAPAAPPPKPGTPVPSGGLPPGTGGQKGGLYGGLARVDPDADRAAQWMAAEGVSGAAAVQKRAAYGFDPTYTLDAAAEHKGLFAPIIMLDAEQPATAARFERLVKERSVAGIRLTGVPAADGGFPWMDSAVAHQTWDVAERYGLVVDLMVSDINRSAEAVPVLTRLARRYPHVRLVLDHSGYPAREGSPTFGFDEARASLAHLPNLYLKITTVNFDLLRESRLSPVEFVQRAVAVHGPGHVLWGSDVGNSGGTYHQLCARAREAVSALPSRAQRSVLHDVGARVFVRGGNRHA